MIFRFSIHVALVSAVAESIRVSEKTVNNKNGSQRKDRLLENDMYIPENLKAGYKPGVDVDDKEVERSLKIEMQEGLFGTNRAILRNVNVNRNSDSNSKDTAGTSDGAPDVGILQQTVEDAPRWKSRNLVVGCEDPYVINADDNLQSILYDCLGYSDCCYDVNFECWDVSRVTDMSFAFYNNVNGIPDISNWDTSSVTNMAYMLAYSGDTNLNIEKWDVSNVQDMSGMFQGLPYFDKPLRKWDVSSVTDMKKMFKNTGKFNKPIEDWDISGVTSTASMFEDAKKFNKPVDGWNTTSVTDMSKMFKKAKKFKQCLSTWSLEGDGSRNTDEMFKKSSCIGKNNDNPPEIGPWCLYEADGCYQEGCTDTDGLFSYVKEIDCDTVRGYSIEGQEDACLNIPEVAAMCPTVCDGSCGETMSPTSSTSSFMFETLEPILCPDDDTTTPA